MKMMQNAIATILTLLALFFEKTVAGAASWKKCSRSDDCDDTEFCWNGYCRDTRDKSMCATWECIPTVDRWEWKDLYLDSNFKCPDRPVCNEKSNKHFSYGCNFQKNYFILGRFKDLGKTATKEECLEKAINADTDAPGVQWQNQKCYAKWYDIAKYGRKWKPYGWASIMGDTYACFFEVKAKWCTGSYKENPDYVRAWDKRPKKGTPCDDQCRTSKKTNTYYDDKVNSWCYTADKTDCWECDGTEQNWGADCVPC